MFKQKAFFSILSISMVFTFAPSPVQAQLDDPTRPPGFRLVTPGGKKVATIKYFSLSSVRISSTRRSAVVNDRPVEAGDTVDGARVIAIYPSAVKLNKQGKTFTVRLIKNVVQKTMVR